MVFLSEEYHISGIGSLIMISLYVYYIRVLIKDQKKGIEDMGLTNEKITKKKEIIKQKDNDIYELEETIEKRKSSLIKKVYCLS